MAKDIYVRSLMKQDLSAIVEMEDRGTGLARPEYWKERIELSEGVRPHWASLVAEVDGRIGGVILGHGGQLEFGLPGTVAWIEYIRIDTVYRGLSVGRVLIDQFTASAEQHGMKTIFTLIEQDNQDMTNFLSRLGFEQGRMLHFQKPIGN